MGPGQKRYLTTIRLGPVGTKACDAMAEKRPHSHQGAPSIGERLPGQWVHTKPQ